MALIKRSIKGSNLTPAEVDANFEFVSESDNKTGTITFDKGNGYYINSPTSPVTTTPIVLSKTDAVKGGFVGVYYKGAVLTYTDFSPSGDIILFNDGGMVANELCMIWINYDLTNDVFGVSIQTGAIGVTPTVNPPLAPSLSLSQYAFGATPPLEPSLSLSQYTF